LNCNPFDLLPNFQCIILFFFSACSYITTSTFSHVCRHLCRSLPTQLFNICNFKSRNCASKPAFSRQPK
jgi:hypothetical protein